MFLYLPVINEKGQFLISKIKNTTEQYTILYDTTSKYASWKSAEVFIKQLIHFLILRTNLVPDQIMFIESSPYGNILALVFLAFCPFNSADVQSSRHDEELKWVYLKELPILLHKEDLFIVDILQKFCLHTNFGLPISSLAVN